MPDPRRAKGGIYVVYRTPKNHDVVAHGLSKHESKVEEIRSETQT